MTMTALLLLSIVAVVDASGYQQYLERYAGNHSGQPQSGGGAAGYQQYVDRYTGNRSNQLQSGGAAGGGYQHYLEQYAGDHAGGSHSNQAQSGGAAGADYQQYLERYAGNYGAQGHAGGMSAGSDSSQPQFGGASGAGYQQYLDGYAGAYATQAHAGDRHAGNHSSQPQSGAAAGGVQGGTNSADAWMPHVPAWERYGGEQSAANESYQDIVARYAGPYTHPQEFRDAPRSASACHTMHDLNEWLRAEDSRIRAYVPKEYQSFPERALNHTYSENAARIRREEQALAGNSSNRTLDEQAGRAPAEAAQPSASPQRSSQGTSPHAPSSSAAGNHTPPEVAQSQQPRVEAPASNASAGATVFLAMPASDVQLPRTGYQQYLDGYTGGHVVPEHTGGRYAGNYSSQPQSGGFAGAGYQQYLDRYAGGGVQGGGNPADAWMPHVPAWERYGEEQSAANESYQDIVARYAGPYAHPQEFRDAPRNASACHTMHDLNEWLRAEDSWIRAYVPKEYQSFPERALNHTYSENAARIRREEQALAGNSSNRTLDEQAGRAPAEAAQPSASRQRSSQGTSPHAAGNHTPPEGAQSQQPRAEAPASNASAGATAFLAMRASDVQLPRSAGGTSAALSRLLAALALVGALAAVAMTQRRHRVSVSASLSAPLVAEHDV